MVMARRLLFGAAFGFAVIACVPEGTVLDSAMSLEVSNQTTIAIALFVNEAPIAVVSAGQAEKYPATALPALPWRVEAKSPSGRALLTLTVRSGDVIVTERSTRGVAERVDLSCGRIDVWSGPPLAGPAPGPGRPGDCD